LRALPTAGHPAISVAGSLESSAGTWQQNSWRFQGATSFDRRVLGLAGELAPPRGVEDVP